jgi:hypothetical protein
MPTQDELRRELTYDPETEEAAAFSHEWRSRNYSGYIGR